MKIEDVKDIISFAEVNGYSAKVSDVSYIVLENTFSNKTLAYRALFNNTENNTEEHIKEYDKSEMIQCIKQYMFSNKYIITNDELDEIKNKDNISAEENREGLIKLIGRIENAMDNGKMSQKDGIAKMVDIRSRLQSKFEMEKTNERTNIIIPPSYNAICPYCGHEVTAKTEDNE